MMESGLHHVRVTCGTQCTIWGWPLIIWDRTIPNKNI